MNEQLRPLYHFSTFRWDGQADVHLVFRGPEPLPQHIECLRDDRDVPDWIMNKLSEERQQELQTLFGLSKVKRLETEAAVAAQE